MKHKWFFCFMSLATCLSVMAGELKLVENGKSEYTIVVPDEEDSRNRVGEAASVLQDFVLKMSDVKLPIVKEAQFAGGKAVYLGKTRKSINVGIPFDELKEWRYTKRVIDGDLYLAGYDASANIKGDLEHHDKEYLGQFQGFNMNETRAYREWRGTHKAVLSLLDNELGVRFLLPGEMGIYIPKLSEIAVPDDLNYLGQAAFPYCNGRVYGDRNLTIALNHNDVPFYKTYGGHSFPTAVPRPYRKTNPEYFVLVNGKRQPDYGPGGAGHLCVSNPEVQELIMKELERQYDNGFRWVQLAQTDGMVKCECEECQKLGGGDNGELLWTVFRKIAEQMKVRRPQLKIVILVYHDTKVPPKSFETFPDNVMLEMCIWKDYPGFLKTWEKFHDVPKIAYIYFWGAYNSYILDPCRNLKYLADNLRIMKENNFLSIFKCGWGQAIGLEGPQYYVFSKLLEDPYQDPYALLDDFCNHAYGKAAPVMKQFFLAIDKALTMPDGGSTLDALEIRPRHVRQMHMHSFSLYTTKYLDNRLWYASTQDNDPLVQARIKLARREFDFLKQRTFLYILSEAYNAAPCPELLAILEKQFNKATALVDSWYDENGRMKHQPGFDWPFLGDTPKNVLMFGGGAMNPSFPPELACGIAPLKEALKMPLKPEDYNFPVTWIHNDRHKEEIFNGHDSKKGTASFGNGDLETSFNAAYDKDNLYVFIQAKSPNNPSSLKAVGHDGQCPLDDSLEIFLDIEGNRKKYYHFQFNPIADSFAEARRGYQEDPLHPDFGREDITWNGKWTYEVKYNAEKQVWNALVTIPFSTLDTKRISYPGAQWNMNLVRHALKDGKTTRSSWVALPAETPYDNPDTFGKITFGGFRY